jgi:hypothetical protein
MSEENKVVKTSYCELHAIPSFHKTDGSIVHTCGECHPEINKNDERESHFRIQNYGAHDAAAGGFCDSDTLDWLKMCATISIQCPPKALNDFHDDHLDFTGYECDGKFVYSASDANKYWYSATVEFDWDDELKFNTSFKICQRGNRKAIYSVALAGFLLANGLKIGKNS